MKNWLAIAVILTSGCTKQSAPSSAQAEVPSVDYFSKKQTCYELMKKVEKDLDKSSREAFAYAQASKNSFTYSTIDSVCYSKKFNTCVGFETENQYSSVSAKVIQSKFFRTINIYTNEPIGYVMLTYDKRGQLDKESSTPDPFGRQEEIRKYVDCAQ